MSIRTILGTTLLILSTAVSANWHVNPEGSSVTFASVKKGDVAEVHSFSTLAGTLSDQGAFDLIIPLTSVNTGIEIRDERMKELLFEIDRFPRLILKAEIEPSQLATLIPGVIKPMEVSANISLHGKTQTINVKLLAARINDKQMLISSSSILIINAAEFDLLDGVEKLRELAGLPAISPAVPVSFLLLLEQ